MKTLSFKLELKTSPLDKYPITFFADDPIKKEFTFGCHAGEDIKITLPHDVIERMYTYIKEGD